jgi:hypothetical protein
VIVFSVNRYLVPQKREKLFFDKRVFRYSATVVREKHENAFFGERTTVNGYSMSIPFYSPHHTGH